MERELNKLFLKELKHQRTLKIARMNKAINISESICLYVCRIGNQDPKKFKDIYKSMRELITNLNTQSPASDKPGE